jgi:hypothetical protein
MLDKLMKIRDRIRELRRVQASELLPNPKNWRTHPQAQQDALRGVLAEIGFADALLARETETGQLMLIDGHLRAETMSDALVPVLVLDVDEAEAAKLLATLDPLAALAEVDREKLDELLPEIETTNAALRQMLAELAGNANVPEAAVQPPTIPELWRILIDCQSEAEQDALLVRFQAEGIACRALVS